jgi:hypothetical protein
MERERSKARRPAGSKGLGTCSSLSLSKSMGCWSHYGAFEILEFDTFGHLKSCGGGYRVRFT